MMMTLGESKTHKTEQSSEDGGEMAKDVIEKIY
jgi:hypothetical protein